MRKIHLLITGLILVPAVLSASGEELRPAAVDDLMRIKNIYEARISPDGTRIIYVTGEPDPEQNGYNSDIWITDLEKRDHFPLTNGHRRDDSPRWSPDGKNIAFISDRSGKPQIWIIRPDGGEAVKLTDTESGTGFFSWAPDSRRIAYLIPDPDPQGKRKDQDAQAEIIKADQDMKMIHIHIIDIQSGVSVRLTEGDFSVDSFCWSPDGNSIAFSGRPSPEIEEMFNSDIYTIRIHDKNILKVVERKGVDTSPQWSPDGKSIAFVSTDGVKKWIANWYICAVPAEGGIPRNISQDFDEFVSSCTWSPDSRRIYFSGNKGVSSHLFAVSVDDGKIEKISRGMKSYRNFSFSKDFKHVSFLLSDPSFPEEVHFSRLHPFVPERITHSNPHLNKIKLGKMEIVRWQSFDGMEMEGLLIHPAGGVEKKRYPLLTYVHGGPSGKFGISFSPQMGGSTPVQAESYPLHVFAGKNYAIFLPNPRGSYGYGEKFRMSNVKDWGGGDYEDIMSGIDHLIEKGLADPDRLGIMGRSYGGYMTAWIITQTERFRAASLGAGMSNLISFYGQTDIPGYMEYYFGGSPWEKRPEYVRRSPVTYAMKVKTPVLILHGGKDARVPLPQAEEFYRALKKNGVPVEFIIYPGQGHTSRNPHFQRDMMERNLEWFETRLKKP